jgi:hypothetical protein
MHRIDCRSSGLSYVPVRAALMGLGLLCAAFALVGCSTQPGVPQTIQGPVQAEVPTLESTFGIRVEGLRLSAAGSMLDFRYRVLDAQKAALLLNGKVQPYLLDEAHGAKLGVPDAPVLGRIRQTARNNNIHLDRTYFIMFGNPGKAVQSGDKVTLLMDKTKIADLTVQ